MKRATVIVFLLLAACGGGGSKHAAATTTTVKAASVRQVATIIAEAAPGIRGAAGDVSDCAVRSIDPEPCGISAQLHLTTLAYASQSLVLKLDGADTPGNGLFIGAIPAEVRDLFTRTKSAAHELQDATSRFQGLHCSQQPVDADCGPTFLRIQMAYDPLVGDFDAWTPYL